MSTQLVQSNQIDSLQIILDAIDNARKANGSALADSTKHQYSKAITNAVNAGVNLTDAQSINDYAQTVGSSTRMFLKASIRLLTMHTEHIAKSTFDLESVEETIRVQAVAYKCEALRDAVQVDAHKGQKAHSWLSQLEVKELLNACDVRNSGNAEFPIIAQRDRLALGLCVGAGLRRLEAVNLKFSDVVLQHSNGKTRTVLNVTGKGAKDRVVPISDTLAQAIKEMHNLIGDGYILRSLGRNKQFSNSMSSTALYNLVQKRGKLIGKADLQPHDLRRTYATIGFHAGVDITQISMLLGHSNIETTMRYLNIELDLSSTISDFVPFS